MPSGDGTVCDGQAIVGICDTPTTTFPNTTTTSIPSTTTTTLAVGACCYSSFCDDVTADACAGGLLGTYQGDGTSCNEPGICVDCGSGCVDFGEECDDGNTATGDGCDDKCATETCFKCTEAPGVNARTIVACVGPPTCDPDVAEECAVCGDGEIYPGEDCEDGNTVGGDCCSAECTYEDPGSPCPDSVFCDGAETCDGSGLCVDAPSPADCSSLDSECAVGVCDVELDDCVADPSDLEGAPCEDTGDCTVSGSGFCEDGVCVGDGTTLSPSCRWIVVGGSPEGDVRVRTGPGSMVDANTCGDTARWAGTTSASMVATTASGEGIRFYGPPVVEGDIVTGGSSAGAGLYLEVPGTTMKSVPGGSLVAKVPSGFVDTTGTHPLVDECNADKASLPGADTVLDGMTVTETAGDGSGLRVPIGGSASIDVTGDGVAVVEMANLKVSRRATLTLTGLPGDVVMLKILGPRMVFGFGARLVLDGLLEQNVLIYSQGRRCKISHEVTGGGTVFCPEATKFHVGVGARWTGSFLGGTREVRVRQTAELTHAPFTGF